MLEKLSRFYLSKKTFLIAIIATMLLEISGMIMELTLDELIPFELIAYGILFLLLIGLFITYYKKDHILMNGLVSGILIYEFVRYVYLLSLFTDDTALSYFRDADYFVCFCFSFMFLAVAVVCVINYNHFTLNRSRAINRTKIILNQFLLFLSFFVPIVFIIMNATLGYSLFEIITYATIYLGDACLLLVVACCELELAVNRRDKTALEELNHSDVKAALWYAFSFFFALLCLCMTVLLTDTGAFVYVINNIDFFLSLGLLFYYLNKKKKPSPGFRILLGAGFITTVGIFIFSVGYFIWTSLA